MRKAPVLVTMLLVAGAMTVIATTPSEHTSPEESLCWSCHAPGLWSPALAPPQLEEMFFEQRNGDWWLVAELHNPWLHELSYTSGVVDGAGALALRSTPFETIEGELAPGPLPQEIMAVHMLETPDAMRGQRITLDYDSITPHNVDMRITGADGVPIGELSEGGTGDPDVILVDAHHAATARSPWSIQVSTDSGLPETISYTISFEEMGGFAARGTSAPINGSATIAWPVDGNQDMENTTQVHVYYDMYYEHEPGTVDSDLDFGRLNANPEVGSFDGQPYFVEPEEDEIEDDEFIPGPGVLLLPALLWAARRR